MDDCQHCGGRLEWLNCGHEPAARGMLIVRQRYMGRF